MHRQPKSHRCAIDIDSDQRAHAGRWRGSRARRRASRVSQACRLGRDWERWPYSATRTDGKSSVVTEVVNKLSQRRKAVELRVITARLDALPTANRQWVSYHVKSGINGRGSANGRGSIGAYVRTDDTTCRASRAGRDGTATGSAYFVGRHQIRSRQATLDNTDRQATGNGARGVCVGADAPGGRKGRKRNLSG